MTIGWNSRRASLLPVLLLLLGIAAIAYHHFFDATGTGFDRHGIPLVIYHCARIVLAIYLMAVCYGLGYWALIGLRQPLSLRGAKAFIACFFLGASIYGVAFSLLGLFNVLSVPLALAATLPVILFLNAPLEALWDRDAFSELLPLPQQAEDRTEAFTRLGLVGVLALAFVLFVIVRVLFIANPDGNVWEHYLHYYRSVLQTGSTQPGEVWHHFYNSKGGGLTFVAIFLGDLFAVQLVSACFVIAAAVIVFDLLRDVCADLKWSLFGVCLYFSFFIGDVSDGGLFRVHAVILGYAAFLFWVWQQLPTVPSQARAPLLIAFFASLAYVGFYQPVASGVFAPAFVVMYVGGWLTGDRRNGFLLAVLCGVMIGAGTAMTIGINWLLTGLPEVTPMKALWTIAQQDKAARIFGTGGIDFFLAVNNDVTSTTSLFQRIYGNIRYLPTKAFTYLTIIVGLVLAVLALVRATAGWKFDRAERFVVSAILFVIPFVALTVIFPSPSLYRMALYTNMFVIFATVIIWQKALAYLPADWLANPLSLSSRSDGKPIDVSVKEVCTIAFLAVVALGMLLQGIKGTRDIRSPIVDFATGYWSLEDTMMEVERLNPRMVSGTSVQAVSEFRRQTGYAGRLLGLTYDASYAYVLPGAGVVSEPTYAIVRDPARLVSEDSDTVADTLRSLKIEYITLNFPSRLFTTYAFTSLFAPGHVGNYFDLAYERGSFVILRLRNKSDSPDPTHRIPDYALSILEMKQKGVLHFPFTRNFAEALAKPGRATITSADQYLELRKDFVRELARLLTEQVIDPLSLPQSKDVLRSIVNAALDHLITAEPGAVLSAPRAFNGELIVRMPEIEARKRMVLTVRNMLRSEYAVRFGASLANLFESCDERVPFSPNRPADARCQ